MKNPEYTPEIRRKKHYARHKRQNHKSKAPIQNKHNYYAAQHSQHLIKHHGEGVFHKTPELLSILSHSVHKRARLLLRNISYGKSLNFFIHPGSHIHAYTGAQTRA